MSRIVLDASVVLTWCFQDEETQKASEIAEWIARGSRISVPPFWRHEVLNALLVAERGKRIVSGLTDAFLVALARLPVDVDDRLDVNTVLFNTQSLSRHHGLTAYDAAYLELAVSLGCALATVDRELRRAAEAQGVAIV